MKIYWKKWRFSLLYIFIQNLCYYYGLNGIYIVLFYDYTKKVWNYFTHNFWDGNLLLKTTKKKLVKLKKPLKLLSQNSVKLKKNTESYFKFGLNTEFLYIQNHWKTPLNDPIKHHWKVVCMHTIHSHTNLHSRTCEHTQSCTHTHSQSSNVCSFKTGQLRWLKFFMWTSEAYRHTYNTLTHKFALTHLWLHNNQIKYSKFRCAGYA